MEYKKRLKEIKKELLQREKKTHKKVKFIHRDHIYEEYSCLCTDRDRNFKELYPTEHEAEQRAKFLLDEQGISLTIYPCPYNYGWHLSRR